MSKASQSLLSCHDLDEMLNCVMDLVFENLPSERGCIFLYDEVKEEQTMRVMRTQEGSTRERFTISTTVTSQTIAEKTSVLCSDTAADDRFSEQHSIIFSKISSVMCAPRNTLSRNVAWSRATEESMARVVKTSRCSPLNSWADGGPCVTQRSPWRPMVPARNSASDRED